jgi:phosphatidylinositol alpha-1,6-mannosyltransferase
MSKNISLLSLHAFSVTGGIQKMTRTMAHSLHKICTKNNWTFNLSSLYDTDDDLMPEYVPAANFKGYAYNRPLFVLKMVLAAKKNDIIILTHINLAIVGLLSKIVNPKCEIWLIAHGIEVWRPLSFHKRLILKYAGKIICVSNYTKQQMFKWHQTEPSKCYVLNNAVDPFITLSDDFNKPEYLLNRYSLNKNDIVLFSLTRLSSTEKYKGHDRVIEAIAHLKTKFPNIKYVLSGKFDQKEELRIKQLVADAGVEGQVLLTGFIKESELTDHFLLADLFVLPSKKEGFGIVFIEALACGLPVICGDADGSVDAIRNGELGTAINADTPVELEDCISQHLANPSTPAQRKHLQQKCLEYFNEDQYIKNLEYLIDHRSA